MRFCTAHAKGTGIPPGPSFAEGLNPLKQETSFPLCGGGHVSLLETTPPCGGAVAALKITFLKKHRCSYIRINGDDEDISRLRSISKSDS